MIAKDMAFSGSAGIPGVSDGVPYMVLNTPSESIISLSVLPI